MQLEDGSLLIMADVDEIPTSQTMALLRACKAPLPMHLQLANYLYSFEFPTTALSWRAQVHSFRRGVTSYNHGRTTDALLLDGGWHCSFCFWRIAVVQFKKKSYSHADRLFGNLHSTQLLDERVLRKKLCTGEDVFGMLPEAYTWSDLLLRWNGQPHSAHVANLPTPVLLDPSKYS